MTRLSVAILSGFAFVTMVGSALADVDLRGKTLKSKGGTFVLEADGTLSGEVKGEALSGVWSVKGDKFCRTIKAPAALAGKACQAMTVDGKKLTLTRDDGSKVNFTIN